MVNSLLRCSVWVFLKVQLKKLPNILRSPFDRGVKRRGGPRPPERLLPSPLPPSPLRLRARVSPGARAFSGGARRRGLTPPGGGGENGAARAPAGRAVTGGTMPAIHPLVAALSGPERLLLERW